MAKLKDVMTAEATGELYAVIQRADERRKARKRKHPQQLTIYDYGA